MQAKLEISIDFGATGNSREYAGFGWALAEPGFTWAIGMESHLRIPDVRRAGDLILILDVVPFVRSDDLPSQRLIVSVNGVVVGSCSFRRPSLLGYCIAAEVAGQSGDLAITLQHPDAARPSEFAISADARMLAFSVAQVRLYYTEPNFAGRGQSWRTRAGVMMSGRDLCGFCARRTRDVGEWVAQRTGLDLQALALRFESIGENCEFGLVQRRCDVEPLGLLRFSSTFLRPLIHGLDDGFERLGDPDDVDPRLEGDGPAEYMIHEKVYGLTYHSFVYEGERDVAQMRAQEASRLRFLRRKFIEELGAAEKIFVYKRNTPVSEEEILPLFMSLRRRGDNTLLWVVPAERDRPAGTVEVVLPGLLKGYIDRFAPETNAYDFSFDGWMHVCANALVLADLSKGGK